MARRPYKFLDAFEREDHEIFFGRQREVEEIHSRLFYSNLLVLYGPSGTGKTSILKCGLTNRIPESDWKPVYIRRNLNISEAIGQELNKMAQTPLKHTFTLEQKLRSVYLDYLTPVFLIFDQLEELFVFGDQSEQQEFARLITSITNDPENNVKVIFIIREEYLADLSSFEEMLPKIFDNRFRIERMGRTNIIEAIQQPAEVCDVELDEGLPEEAIEKITDEKGNIELTYVQVLMDHLYKMAEARDKVNIHLQLDDLRKLGQLSNLMSKFLDEQLLQMENAKAGEDLLKTMISLDGTKKPMRTADIERSLQQLNKKVEHEKLLSIVQYFVNVRILREKDENGFYELRHDSLAYRIFERMTLVEKELIEVQQFLRQAFERYKRRRMLLRKEDLEYIAPYEAKLIPDREIKAFLLISKKALQRALKRKRNIAIVAGLCLILVLSGFSIWALKERSIAEYQKKEAVLAMESAEKSEQIATRQKLLADKARTDAENAYEIAQQEIYENIKTSLVISPDNMNVLYNGIWNPLSFSVSGLPPDNLSPTIVTGFAKIRGKSGKYEIKPEDTSSEIEINVKGYIPEKGEVNFGSMSFRTSNVPTPVTKIAGKRDGIITMEELMKNRELKATIPDFLFSGVSCFVSSFKIVLMINNLRYENTFQGNSIDQDFFNKYNNLDSDDNDEIRLWFEDILIRCSFDDKQHYSHPMIFRVLPEHVDPDQLLVTENVNKLLFAVDQELQKQNIVTAYRFAEAAVLLDPDREDVIRKFIYVYRLAFADVKQRFGLDNSSSIFLSEKFKNILELYAGENEIILGKLYEVLQDSLAPIIDFKFPETRFDSDRYNAMVTDDYFVISRLTSGNVSHTENIVSIYNNNGKLIAEDTIHQRCGNLFRSSSNTYFISNPTKENIIRHGAYDNRTSLWNKNEGFIRFLWGHEDFSRLYDLDKILIMNIFSKDEISMILGCNHNHNTLEIYNFKGNLLKSIPTVIDVDKAFISDENELFYYGKNTQNMQNQLKQLNKFDTYSKHVMLFDSLVSFSFTLAGDYFLISKLNSENDPVSLLYDTKMNLLATYLTWIPDGTIFIDTEQNTLIHIQDDGSGKIVYHTVLPIVNPVPNILDEVNKKQRFGNILKLGLDDFNRYFIADDYSNVIFQYYDQFE